MLSICVCVVDNVNDLTDVVLQVVQLSYSHVYARALAFNPHAGGQGGRAPARKVLSPWGGCRDILVSWGLLSIVSSSVLFRFFHDAVLRNLAPNVHCSRGSAFRRGRAPDPFVAVDASPNLAVRWNLPANTHAGLSISVPA